MAIEPYDIIPPQIPSAGVYHFDTDSGLEYEVRFARKKDNLLNTTVAFGVLNDEYEGEEYIETNRGEVFRVMATIVAVVRMYLVQHPNVRVVEFTGEPTEDENENETNQRVRLYQRYLPQIFTEGSWEFNLVGNHMVCERVDH